jgi:acyl-CoA dehydrogenase
MGMRGTVSPGFRIECDAPLEQLLPEPFGDIFACSMVPYSHILWSALWHGIAAGALGKAGAYVRGLARKTPGVPPPVARDLAELTVELEALRAHWQSAAIDFDEAVAAGRDREEYASVSRALKMSSLKIACSEASPRIVHGALQVLGMLAYKNDSPYSLNREYRDALSGAIMISNGRITGKLAGLMLVQKGS